MQEHPTVKHKLERLRQGLPPIRTFLREMGNFTPAELAGSLPQELASPIQRALQNYLQSTTMTMTNWGTICEQATNIHALKVSLNGFEQRLLESMNYIFNIVQISRVNQDRALDLSLANLLAAMPRTDGYNPAPVISENSQINSERRETNPNELGSCCAMMLYPLCSIHTAVKLLQQEIWSYSNSTKSFIQQNKPILYRLLKHSAKDYMGDFRAKALDGLMNGIISPAYYAKYPVDSDIIEIVDPHSSVLPLVRSLIQDNQLFNRRTWEDINHADFQSTCLEIFSASLLTMVIEAGGFSWPEWKFWTILILGSIMTGSLVHLLDQLERPDLDNNLIKLALLQLFEIIYPELHDNLRLKISETIDNLRVIQDSL